MPFLQDAYKTPVHMPAGINSESHPHWTLDRYPNRLKNGIRMGPLLVASCSPGYMYCRWTQKAIGTKQDPNKIRSNFLRQQTTNARMPRHAYYLSQKDLGLGLLSLEDATRLDAIKMTTSAPLYLTDSNPSLP